MIINRTTYLSPQSLYICVTRQAVIKWILTFVQLFSPSRVSLCSFATEFHWIVWSRCVVWKERNTQTKGYFTTLRVVEIIFDLSQMKLLTWRAVSVSDFVLVYSATIRIVCTNAFDSIHCRLIKVNVVHDTVGLLRGMETFGRFAASLFQERYFCHFLFAHLHNRSLLTRVYSKRKEFAPNWGKFFPFRVDNFSQGEQILSF